MRDNASMSRVNSLHPSIRQEVASLITLVEQSFSPYMAVRVVQGLRTFAEQDALYAQGRTKPGPRVTNAKGGQSDHNYGLAFDFALLYDKDRNGTFEELSWNTHLDFNSDKIIDWMQVVSTFQKHGYEWGGLWKSIHDDPHLEKLFGHTWHDLLILHNTGKVDVQGYVILS